MSWQASAWAIGQQVVTDPTARHVLLCMSNYADQDGTASFPSNSRLCRDTGLSERAVRMALRRLEQAHLIRRGNQAIAQVKINRKDRIPVVYDLAIEVDVPCA